MSYAGAYGADETCRHGCYWRSCSECSGGGARYERTMRVRAEHAQQAGDEPKLREVRYYRATCPGCASDLGDHRTKGEARARFTNHCRYFGGSARGAA